MRYFVSGHLDLTGAEFHDHYVQRLTQALEDGATFVIGDAKGADGWAQFYLLSCGAGHRVTVYHMLDSPRVNAGHFPTVGGFTSDAARDAAMTAASDADIAWVRPGREKSGTALNLSRRKQ
jgi:hypothetical protein